MKKQLFWVLAGTSSFVISLAVMAPLPVLAQQLTRMVPDLQLAGVSGTLWKGRVQRLTLPPVQADNLSWTFAPKKLLSGYLAADMKAELQSSVLATGECGVSMFAKLECSPLQLDMDAANIQKLTPAAQNLPVGLTGNLQAKLESISWDRVGVPVADGQVSWEQGAVNQPIKLNLGGQYLARFKPGDQADQALNIALQSDDKTMLILDGKVNIEKSGDFQLDVFLKPASSADPSMGDALAFMGATQADGSLKIVRKGKLPLPLATEELAAQ